MAWKESVFGLRTASNTATTSLAALSVLVHSRARRREQRFMPTSAEFGTRLLSYQLSDYRVGDPYIQAHLHGLNSRLVLALDDSPNVLRDETVLETACPQRAPVHPSSTLDSPRLSGIAQRQTTPTTGHHCARDPLVMRRSGRHDAHLLRQPQQDHYPTTTPPQHSGGASSTSYRKRRTNTRPPRGSPSDPAHDHQVTRPAATQATLGAATRVRSEPLKTSTHHNAGEVFHGAYCRTLLLIEDGLFEVVPGILSGIGATTFR
jgi:hypothetical protein